MKSYDTVVESMISFLRQRHVCRSSITSHQKCYQRFEMFVTDQKRLWEPNTVSEWITRLRVTEDRQLCSIWNQYMRQLEEFRNTGTVSDRHLYLNRSTYDRLEYPMKAELNDYLSSCKERYTQRSFSLARNYLAGMLIYFEDCGKSSVREISYTDVIAYYQSDFCSSRKNRAIYLGHARRFFEFMHHKQKCPAGFHLYLHDNYAPYVGNLDSFEDFAREQILAHAEESLGFPLKEFFFAVADFTDSLKVHRYGYTSIKTAKHVLMELYLFLDIHNLGYHPCIAETWFSEMQPVLPEDWKHWRRLLALFDEFTQFGDIIPTGKYTYKPTALDALPEWCASQIGNYISLLEKEFHAPGTLRSYRFPCIRLCRYLVDEGLTCFGELTSDILQSFCSQDQHNTFRGKSSCFGIIRKFIMFLEDNGQISNRHLHLCIDAGCAPGENIIDILSAEQCHRIDQYRGLHETPMELRRIAMVMLGIKMGFRASDVINLKFQDISWSNRSITIIQEKTKSSLTLPMPVSVGNAIYKYMKQGRPSVDSEYVFIRHKAPYGKLTGKTCTIALWSILPERKERAGGFHVTRRTFATNVLRNGASADRVMDTLGHTDPTSVMKYLSMDEDRMRMCPLSLSDIHLSWKEV